jgi:5-methylcytosine-specific restriction endonuclease McrA
MTYVYTKHAAECELARYRAHLLSYPNHIPAIEGIKRFEDLLKKNYPESEVLIKAPAIGPVNPRKSATKKKISAAVKKLVWNTNIGEDIGKSKCMCCNSTDITQLSFNCGHIVAESKGGATIVSNLKPICQNCNSSMGPMNMIEFMQSLK